LVNGQIKLVLPGVPIMQDITDPGEMLLSLCQALQGRGVTARQGIGAKVLSQSGISHEELGDAPEI
jgi:hypothetical protein